MNRRFSLSRLSATLCLASLFAAGTIGMQCPPDGGAPLDPPPADGNRAPRIQITSIDTPGGNETVEQGDLVTINFTGGDTEDRASVRVFASASSTPTSADEIPILSNFPLGPGTGSGRAFWRTNDVETGSYFVFAEIDDKSVDSNGNAVNLPVRAGFENPVLVVPRGIGGENAPPVLTVNLPSTDAGLSNEDVLSVRYTLSDSESDVDTLTVRVLFDKDRSASNDGVDAPLEVASETIIPGTLPKGVAGVFQEDITIDLNLLPIRSETDEAGRPLPYFIRVEADDGEGHVVNKYANGGLQLLRAASDVTDLKTIGSTTAGATWQGFNGDSMDLSRGSRAGSAFAPIGDFDGDGLDDFVIIAETASPFNYARVGAAYVIYGRERRLNPDLAQLLPFGTGRYAGVNNLNTVGSFVSFPPEDPRFQTVFNIRGHIMTAPPSLSGQVLGLTSVTRLPDQTGDGLPEILIGSPLNDSQADSEDDDPCDTCTLGDGQGETTCFEQTPRFNTNAMTAEIAFDVDPVAGTWTPFDPSNPQPFFPPNADFELEEARVLEIDSFSVTIEGQTANMTSNPFVLLVKLENDDGPEIQINVTGGNFTDAEGSFVVTGNFPVTQPSLPVDVGGLPPSLYDGIFTVFVRSSVTLTETMMTVQATGFSMVPTQEPLALRARYPDEFPNPFSTVTSTETGIDPQLLQDLGVVCPPQNRSVAPLSGQDPYGNLDGHLCPEVRQGLVGCNGPVDDALGGTSDLSGCMYIVASDNVVTPITPGTDTNGDGIPDGPSGIWTGAGLRRPELVQAGQPDLGSDHGGAPYRGGRIRGAWSNPTGEYDPLSQHSYTIDTIPDMDTTYSPDAEVLVSAPAGGVFGVPASVDVVASIGGVFSNDPSLPGAVTTATVSFDLDSQFSNVELASVFLSGQATGAPVIQIGLDDGAGGFLPGSVREAVLWQGVGFGGDVIPGTIEGNTIDFAQFFDFPTAVSDLLIDGAGTLRIRIREDCAVRYSSFTIDSAQVFVGGLARNVGYVRIYEGDDYTNGEIIEARHCPGLLANFQRADSADGLAAPSSWPSFFGRCPTAGFERLLCDIDTVADIFGEAAGDTFGFAHNGGDLNQDGVPDVICGAPGNDNDPMSPSLNCGPEPNPLVNNGKVYVIFGSPVLGSGRPCDLPERVEIRGSHNDDQFGRVQGNAGDIDGDGISDVFVGAEGYDALGEDFDGDGKPDIGPRGPNAGFVGVLYGRDFSQGALSIRAERIGTPNFPGVKFVGGVAGARLGGGSTGFGDPNVFGPGQRGQYGVSSAGDFNLDGYDDLLITAPGQSWPAAKIEFTGPVVDGDVVSINGLLFEFDNNNNTIAGRRAVKLTDLSAENAARTLINVMNTISAETLGVAAPTLQIQFPPPKPDVPTINFVRRTYTAVTNWVTTSRPSGTPTIKVTEVIRSGAAYLVFGDPSLLTNKTFVLPQDLNRRNSDGKRVLKGMVFVAGYEKDVANDPTPDAAPIEVVSLIGDIDGDGRKDIILGAPQADFVNIINPDDRRQQAGEAYLIYGSSFGLNDSSLP